MKSSWGDVGLHLLLVPGSGVLHPGLVEFSGTIRHHGGVGGVISINYLDGRFGVRIERPTSDSALVQSLMGKMRNMEGVLRVRPDVGRAVLLLYVRGRSGVDVVHRRTWRVC